MHLLHLAVTAPSLTGKAEDAGNPDDSFRSSLMALRAELFRRALFLSGDRDTANDLAQEAIVRALNARHRFQTGTNLRAWVTSIMRNAFFDECRHRSHCVHEEVQPSWTPPEDHTGPLDLLSIEDIEVALAALSPRDREVFRLVHFNQLSYREVADLIGIPMSTVGTRLSRTRAKLRRALERTHRARLSTLGRAAGE